MIGFLNIYKPSGMTSNAVVQKVKKSFHLNKVGHMGTLDPMASGILPLAIGKATRLFDYMLTKRKKYIAEFEFGYETDSLDSTGNIIEKIDFIPTVNDIKKTIEVMIGKQFQMPPRFSAKNVNGFRAYELARKGVEFELKPKEIEIFNIELLESKNNIYRFMIDCSSGTYIRSIGRDLAYKLNSKATMVSLERIYTGNFNIDSSIDLDDILSKELSEILISPLDVFDKYDRLSIDKNTYIDLKNGKKVYGYNILNNTFILFNNNIIGICKAKKDYLKIDTFLEE